MIKKKNLSQEDKKTWENFIKNLTGIHDKDKSNSKKENSKNRFKFDLHGFTLDEANKKVKEIIHYCVENNFKEILFITGKGIHSTNEKDIYKSKDFGKLRFSVPEFLKTDREFSNFILSINKANIEDGGEGALLVKLKKITK